MIKISDECSVPTSEWVVVIVNTSVQYAGRSGHVYTVTSHQIVLNSTENNNVLSIGLSIVCLYRSVLNKAFTELY